MLEHVVLFGWVHFQKNFPSLHVDVFGLDTVSGIQSNGLGAAFLHHPVGRERLRELFEVVGEVVHRGELQVTSFKLQENA